MEACIDLNIDEQTQVAGTVVEGTMSIILGSDEIGFSLQGTNANIIAILQTMLNIAEEMNRP
jgi:hypothetical protein